jgi:osmotically-inducible protein OsmY
MRRALRRAALALLTAGAPGLAGPALAQPLPAAAPTSLPPADTAREGRGRLEEMKVEMAWLADAATFHCPLAARTVDGNLEVRGFVPGESMQEKALKLARAHTYLPVVNALQINPELAPHEAGVNPDAVRQGAVEVLNEAFASAARGFDIRAESGGQVVISGSVNSVEEKLAVSRMLRKVRGCTCVSNYLQISPVMRDGRMVTQINAAGTLVVPGQVLCLDGTGQEPSAVPPPLAAAHAPPPPRVTYAPAPKKVTVTMGTTVAQPSPPPPPVQSVVYPQQPAPAPAVTPVVMPIEVPEPASPAAAPRVEAVTRTGPVYFLPPPPSPSLTPATAPTLQTAKAPAPTPDLPPLPAVSRPSVLLPRDPVVSIPAPAPAAQTTKATDLPPLPPVPSRSSVLLLRDPAVSLPAPAPRPERGVDLLAAPTVPPSWAQGASPTATATAAPKPQPKGPSTFATTRADTARTVSTDELLSLPAIPITTGEKQPAPPAPPAAPVRPVSDKAVTKGEPAVSPLLAAWQTPPPPPANVPTTQKPASATVIVQAPPPAAPAVKPLPVPPATNFKDTWVDAAPAPKAESAPGHPLPPPGGWGAAHLAHPAPTAYVTSGLVVFPDEHDPAIRPAPEPPAARVQPVAVPIVPPAPQPAPAPAPVPAPQPVLRPVAAPVVIVAPQSASGPVITLAPQPQIVTPSTTRLKQQVEKVCGKLAKQVDVTATEKGMTVRVKCADATVAQKVTERVLVNVPEMTDTRVKFEVYVGP